MVILVILLAILAGVLYRAGGTSAGTKWRDFGVPFITLIAILVLKIHASFWVHFFSFGLLFGALCSYNKWASKLAGFTDDEVHWPSWLVTGLFYALAAFLYAYSTQRWLGFGIRCIVLSGATMVWSEKNDNVLFEEFGRGFLIIVSLLLLAV